MLYFHGAAGLFGKEGHAKFYVAGVVNAHWQDLTGQLRVTNHCFSTAEAFEHLHGKKIIFRDLKPENLLLTECGCHDFIASPLKPRPQKLPGLAISS